MPTEKLEKLANLLDGEFKDRDDPGGRRVIFPKSNKNIYFNKFRELYQDGYVVSGMLQDSDEIVLFFGDVDKKEMEK